MAKAVLVFRDAGREKVRLEAQAAEQRRATEEERGRDAEVEAKAAAEKADALKALAGGLAKLSEGDPRETMLPPAPEVARDTLPTGNAPAAGT